MDKLKILFASDYKAGSNPGAIYDLAKERDLDVDYKSKDLDDWDKSVEYDVAVTNNGRVLSDVKAKMKVNTHHGNLFLGDSKPEPHVDVSLAMSESEANMMIANGYSQENVLITGAARTDKIVSPDPDTKPMYLESVNLDLENSTVMYAPTYSRKAFGVGNKAFFANATNAEEEADIAHALVDLIANSNKNMIFRLHGYLKREYDGKLLPEHLEFLYEVENFHITSHHDEPDSIPAIVSSDHLITDFSSIATDFLAAHKPVTFIEPLDNWEYTKQWHCTKDERYDLGKVVHTLEHLLKAIRHPMFGEYNTVMKYCYNLDGNCTHRSLDMILEEYERRHGQ